MMDKARFKLIAEVHLVLRQNEKFLMLRRCNTGYMDGFYSVVAGHVDGEETFRTAMAREAREEAGIVIELCDLKLVHSMHRMADTERVSLFFETTNWSGAITNMEPQKCDDLGWYAPKDIRDNMVPYVASALRAVMEGRIYSEFGW